MNVLLQHAYGPMADCLKMLLGYHERCARANDMVYAWTTEPGDVWTKFKLLADCLALRKPGEMVVWLDADAVIVQRKRNLADALLPSETAGAGALPGKRLHSGGGSEERRVGEEGR